MAYKDPEQRRAYQREYMRRYREQYPERVREYGRRSYQRNRERQCAQTQAWRERNPEKVRDYSRGRYARNTAIINAAKAKPCADCGVQYPPCVMDFDHIDGAKEAAVSTLRTTSVERLMREIAKCEIRCSNCHRLRHARETN